MKEKYFHEIDPIFMEAIRLSGRKRKAYLDRACAGNAALRREVESLLQEDEDGMALLEGSAMDLLAANGNSRQNNDPAPSRQGNRGLPRGSEQCPKGHSFNPVLYESCPTCGVPSLNVGNAGEYDFAIEPLHEPVRQIERESYSSGDRPTSSELEDQLGTNPVVGWLVCVKGPELGRDYRITSGQNTIGRLSHMSIRLENDQHVSRNEHAMLTYDPRGNKFYLTPGTGRGITYLNGEALHVPTTLNAHDIVEVGNTSLRFIPLCGQDFRWA